MAQFQERDQLQGYICVGEHSMIEFVFISTLRIDREDLKKLKC